MKKITAQGSIRVKRKDLVCCKRKCLKIKIKRIKTSSKVGGWVNHAAASILLLNKEKKFM